MIRAPDIVAVVLAWAFFWPEEFGRWIGTIVHAFHTTAGF